MWRLNSYVLVTAASAASALGCASHDSGGGPFADPHVVAKLHDLAEQAVSAQGAPPPTKMYAVAISDHQVAETALGAGIIYDHAAVYVIVITGGPFFGDSAPAGVPLPEGSVLTITLNAATYEGTDAGISNVEPDLSKVASATVNLLDK
jgi:hypothetical protein